MRQCPIIPSNSIHFGMNVRLACYPQTRRRYRTGDNSDKETKQSSKYRLVGLVPCIAALLYVCMYLLHICTGHGTLRAKR